MYAITLTIYIFGVFYLCFALYFSKCIASCFPTFNHIFSVIVETGLFIALLVLYANTLKQFNAINQNDIQYYRDNKCSEGPLQRAFEVLLADMNRDYATAAVGLAFVVVCFFTHLVYIFVNKTVRKILKSIFCCSKAEDEIDYSNVNTNKVAIE